MIPGVFQFILSIFLAEIMTSQENKFLCFHSNYFFKINQ